MQKVTENWQKIISKPQNCQQNCLKNNINKSCGTWLTVQLATEAAKTETQH